jgi:hypothetical protein
MLYDSQMIAPDIVQDYRCISCGTWYTQEDIPRMDYNHKGFPLCYWQWCRRIVVAEDGVPT